MAIERSELNPTWMQSNERAWVFRHSELFYKGIESNFDQEFVNAYNLALTQFLARQGHFGIRLNTVGILHEPTAVLNRSRSDKPFILSLPSIYADDEAIKDPKDLRECNLLLNDIASMIAGVLERGGVVYWSGERFMDRGDSVFLIGRKTYIAEQEDSYQGEVLIRILGYEPRAFPILYFSNPSDDSRDKRIGEALQVAGLNLRGESAHWGGIIFPPGSDERLVYDSYEGFGFTRTWGCSNIAVESLRQVALTMLADGVSGENKWPIRRLSCPDKQEPVVVEDYVYLNSANILTTAILKDVFNSQLPPKSTRGRLKKAFTGNPHLQQGERYSNLLTTSTY